MHNGSMPMAVTDPGGGGGGGGTGLEKSERDSVCVCLCVCLGREGGGRTQAHIGGGGG